MSNEASKYMEGKSGVPERNLAVDAIDSFPKVKQQSYEESTKVNDDDQELQIVVPKMEIVNQRLFCHIVAAKQVKDPKSGLYRPRYTKLAKKDGRIIEIPRFFLAKMSNDIFEETEKGKVKVDLPPGTELFPFFPEVDDFRFPTVTDPYTLEEYTVLHWTELASYMIPEKK